MFNRVLEEQKGRIECIFFKILCSNHNVHGQQDDRLQSPEENKDRVSIDVFRYTNNLTYTFHSTET
jgi:hypothetical protein